MLKKLFILLILITMLIPSVFGNIQRGLTLYNQGKIDQAITVLLPYAKQNTNDKRVYYALFMMYFKKWQLNLAVKHGDQFLKFGKDHILTDRLILAHYNLKNWKKVISIAQYYNSNFGNKHHIYNLMGMAYYYSNNFALAEIAHRTANTLFPNEFKYRNNFGMALEKLGRLKEALRQYNRSVQLNPRYALAITNLKRIKRLIGQNITR